MKGVIPKPDIAKIFYPTPDIKAKKCPTPTLDTHFPKDGKIPKNFSQMGIHTFVCEID